MSKVALVRCENYNYDEVRTAVEKGINLLGGASLFVQTGEKIVLKPNLLTAAAPEKCVTTHPSVFKAVAEVFKNAGADLSYGDSPAFGSPEAVAKKAGLWSAAEELDIKMADFVNGKEVSFQEGHQVKKFVFAKGVVDSDGLISLPKLKTHGLTIMTGGVKNQFGCIPGFLKGEFHVRMPDVNDFARMLVDINRCVKPRLFIMDGILGMEGNGPRGGKPKRMNVLLFSSDPIALDSTVCRMVNINPEYIPTIEFGKKAGLGTSSESEIEIVGDKLENFISKDFDVKREPVKPYKSGGVMGFVRNSLVPRPYINSDKCVKCGICTNMCPVNPKAVNWHDGDKSKVPTYMYNRCIRCYCCQELCPEGAIDLKTPAVRKLMGSRK